MKIFLVTFILASISAVGAPPVLTEAARKTQKSDPEVRQDDIDRYKVDVIKQKTQMNVFKQIIKSEGIESSFPLVTITHFNEMSSRYKIYSLTYTLDDERVFTYYAEENSTKTAVTKETNVFKGPLVPGNHELAVDIVYQGNDTGVFSYINDYKIPAQSKKSFKVDKGQNLQVQVVGFEKGWALTDFKDRPDLKFKFNSPNSTKDLK